ncbi:RNA polymerase sigma-70 factor [Pedobacter sp. MC2016-14]|uniref:RNA polymerase sigma factor n=1 Tax=Pedobacter sp. MC2016-14 TaxID=2897327 RepID=UPI001E37849A|nr:RNA polymerase sigma-70 factor [Pedobacter sp. MC2016-14]MCD0488695.1 RNA polymerase sigma-70 factor [Pedobacter sp. MC2016-14]
MSVYLQHSDFDLIALLRDGDQTAFQEIYLRYNTLLLIYAHKKLQDKEEAKDVVQEVFVKLWANRDDFVLKTTLSGYLYKSVLNKILNIFRHKEFSREYINGLQEILDGESSATDYRIREREISGIIEKEIALLPCKMREVFDLRRKEFLSNKEIAERMNISEHTVATHMKKTLKLLKAKFGRLMIFCFIG